MPVDAFCEAFFDALCEPLESCACGDTAMSDCRSEQRASCSVFPPAPLLEAIEEGRILYDGSEAVALIRRTRDRAERCEGFVAALDWRVRDLLSLGGVFAGTRAAGEPCERSGFELIDTCELGTCAPSPSGYVCLGAVGEGQRCDATHQCIDLDARLASDRGIERLALRCVSDTPDAEGGSCQPYVEAGADCGSDAACWSGRCRDGRCAVLDDGEPCEASRACLSGYCRPSDGTCQPSDAAEGAPCELPAACASHVCIGGRCRPAGCGTF